MSLQMPEIVIESVLREGLLYLQNNISLIDNIFESLTFDYANTKYGQEELEKIKTMITEKQLAIVHSFHEASAKSPAISIQLGSDGEEARYSHLDDFEDDEIVALTDPEDLANLIRIASVVITSYDQTSGTVFVDDAVDLSDIYSNLLFVDDSDEVHTIVGGIDNTTGQKQFMVAAESEVDISNPGVIKSSIDYQQFEVRGVISNVQILLGVHSKDALTTKYLYMLTKYFILSRKADLINRNFSLATYQGSDFTRNLEYLGDHVFTRFLTISGKVEDNWRSDEVIPIENIEIAVKVPQDVATTENLEKEDQTVQISDDDDD